MVVRDKGGRGKWIDVEKFMEEDDVAVFVGNTMGHVSNGYYRPMLHKVVRTGLIFNVWEYEGSELTSINTAVTPNEQRSVLIAFLPSLSRHSHCTKRRQSKEADCDQEHQSRYNCKARAARMEKPCDEVLEGEEVDQVTNDLRCALKSQQ